MYLGKFGIVIRVNDLDSCRVFYRELLQLGEPFVDSSFLVAFHISSDVTLTLEKSQAKYLEHASGAVSILFEVDSMQEIVNRLESAGYEPTFVEIPRYTGQFLRGMDPEGNVFYIRQSSLRAEETL